jgi:WD40 repeat protein/DNA-binding XRE family transcriptional regulator
MPTKSISIALEHFTTFGDLLKYLRRRVGLTQRELSIAVGYSDTQISRLEQNERMPDLATLTARFLPVLHLDDQPEVAKRLLELAATMRREDAPAVGLPPYKGLQYFDEADAELFFGREALTDLLLERLMEQFQSNQRFLAIVGASGSGKSSIVRAGLVAALRWRQPSLSWPVFVLTPTVHPLEALAGILSRETRQSLPVRKLVDELMRDPGTLARSIRRVLQAAGATQAVVVVDQFEELFTLCRSEAEQTAFVDNLMSAACQPDGTALVVIALRADFYAQCARFDWLRQAISQNQEYIGPMTKEELRRAIEEPARHAHWEFEPGLVDLLLHDVGALPGQVPEPGALPLLSHALLATWQRRRGRTLTLSGYNASGGVRGAIAETAEAVFYDLLEPEQREIARQIFLRLTELAGETSTADTRRRVSFNELVLKPGDQETVQEVLLVLADARLVTTDQESAEVAHEALIREWPTLRGWLEEDREGLRLQRRLTESAQEWESLDRDPGMLYRGARLAQALELAQAHPEAINQLEREFLENSQLFQENENLEREAQRLRELDAAQRLAETEQRRAEEQALSSRRLRRRALVLTAALVLAGILAVSALWFWQRAVQANQLANSRELAAAASSNLQVDPERSVLLALEALEQEDTLEARNALHQAVPELHLLRNIQAHPGGVPDVAYSPDGTLVASMGAAGEVKLWDASLGEIIRTLDGSTGEFGGSLAFSPDGNTLAASWATQVVLWDVQSGEVTATFSGESLGTDTGYNLGVGQLCFSPDGKYLAAANFEGMPRVWELATRSEVLALQSELAPQKAIACSPDGKLLASGGDEGIVTVWDAQSGEAIHSLVLGGVLHGVSFSPDGSLVAAASEDGRILVWDAGQGSVVSSPARQSGMYDSGFLADGNFATAGQDGTTRVWDPLSGQQVLVLAGPTSTVISVAGSPDGRRIITGAYDGSLRVWDAAPGRELLTVPGHAAIAWNVAYSPDGERLASASVDGSVKIWDVETGKLLLSLPGNSEQGAGYTGLAFSPDGSSLAAGAFDGTITIWNSQTGEMLETLAGHTNMVTGLAFSPDGRRLASASWDGSAKTWDVSSGEALATFHGKIPTVLMVNTAFHPDGKSVFTSVVEDKAVYRWNVVTGEKMQEFVTEGKEIYGVAISPDGSLLAAGDQDGSIHLWKVETGEKLPVLPGHAGLVVRLTFNRDGTLLASAGFDRLAKIWDIQSGSELFSLYGNPSNVFGVSFSPDGESLATSGADGSVRTYSLDLGALIEVARTRLTRTLSEDECRKFLHTSTCP